MAEISIGALSYYNAFIQAVWEGYIGLASSAATYTIKVFEFPSSNVLANYFLSI